MERDIAIEGLSKVYHQGDEEIYALRDVDLNIGAGEFISVYGPSGSGKSTLLHLIGGLDQPSSGSIRIGENRIEQMSRTQRADFRLHNIGFVFQAYNLIPVLSAQENVEFVMELQGVERSKRTESSIKILQEVGLEGLEHRRPGELSGGQQQRVAVARAIVSQPKIVLADEPTANLDSATSKDLIAIMKEMNERYGVSFVFATHDPLVMESAKRLLQITDGEISSDKICN